MADIDEKDRSRGGGGGGDSGRDRDRSRRGDRPSRFSEGSNMRDRSNDRGGNDRGGRKSSSSRVYVSNISYEYRWQDLKDLFREKVGDVAFVELFVDDHDKPKGCGIVEFSDSASVKKCMEVMHRFELNGRKLVIKEDFGNERDKFGNIINGRRNRDRERQMMEKLDWEDMRDNRRGGGGGGGSGGSGGNGGNAGNWDHHHHHHSNPPSLMNLISKEPLEYKWGNTFGLSPQFLESLNINRPLVNRVFVANLDYKVDEKKLREVFKLCGKVCDVELYHDKDGNSRGFAVVEFDHPVESVQAISMLHNQMLYERPMIVRMDRIDHDVPPKLPDGLKGVGMGLGMNGEPLRDVSRNLPSQNGGNNMNAAGGSGGGGGGGNGGSGGSGGNSGAGILGAMPNQTSLQALGSTAAALSSVVNNPTLAGLSGTSAAALQASLAGVQAPFLNQLGGNLGNSLSNEHIGLGSLTSSNLSSLGSSLAQNHALASLAGGNSMGGGSTGNLTSSLMARGLVGNSDRDYSRNENNSGNNSGGYNMMGSSGGSSNQQSNPNQVVGNRGGGSIGGGGGGGGGGSGVNDYSSNARDYDSASMRSQYDDMQDFRQQTSIYSTVNNGSQNRAGVNNMSMPKGNGYSDTIIVSNLPISATWKMMREKFSNVGDVQFVDMKPKDNQAIVRFSSEWHAERAIKLMDRQRIDGRTIDVRFYY